MLIIKNIIKKYLRNKLTAHPKNYHFLRWISNWFETRENKEHVLACIISYFYHNDFKYPLKEFTDIFLVDRDVYIYTTCPGHWIGRAGSIIYKIEESINRNVVGEKYKIHLIEDLNSSQRYVLYGLYSFMDCL